MQSAMAHAVAEVRRVAGVHLDLNDETQVPFDDATTYDLISSAKTLGVFQIESPGQRELVGKSGIETFDDIITDISLFRPGPVKSDMITPYLEAKHGWRDVHYLHDDLRPILEGTRGVVVFHAGTRRDESGALLSSGGRVPSIFSITFRALGPWS